MLRRSIAALLLILVASPFTAPFETCDLTALFGSPSTVAPLQVQVAWIVNEDSQAVAPGTSISRRVRVALQPISQAAPAQAVASPGEPAPVLLTTASVLSGPQLPPASRSPLRI